MSYIKDHKKKPRFQEEDILGKHPPLEMDDPEEWLLTDAEFEAAWYDQKQVHFPNRWFDAERAIRCDRVARTMLMDRSEGDGVDRASADLPDELELAVELLEEAIPHITPDLAAKVRRFLGKE